MVIFLLVCTHFTSKLDHVMQIFDLVSLVRRESNSGAYFAGMFRLANVEFITEYRQAESNEFVSMANKIQHVVCIGVTLLFA